MEPIYFKNVQFYIVKVVRPNLKRCDIVYDGRNNESLLTVFSIWVVIVILERLNHGIVVVIKSCGIIGIEINFRELFSRRPAIVRYNVARDIDVVLKAVFQCTVFICLLTKFSFF